MYDILELNKKLLPELKEIAKELKIKRTELLKKQDLVYKILDAQAIQEAEKAEKGNKEKKLTDEQKKEVSGLKSFLLRKPVPQENPLTASMNDKQERPRRERIEPIIKHEKVETGKRKHIKIESSVQSRQDQIKAIIKGFGQKPAISEPRFNQPENKHEHKPEPKSDNKIAKPEESLPVAEKPETPVQPVPAYDKPFKVKKQPQVYTNKPSFTPEKRNE